MNKKIVAFLVVGLPVLASISTILGVSFFGGKSVPEATKDVVSKVKGTKTVDVTNPPDVKETPIIIIMTPAPEPILTSNPDNPTAIPEQGTTTGQPTNIPVVVPTAIPSDDSDDIDDNHIALTFTASTPKPDKKRNTKETPKSNTENSDSENNTSTSATETPVLANNESDQTINKELEISSSGYLMLKSKSTTKKQAKKEESTIGISKVTDENGNTVETPGYSSFKYSEIVNEDNPEQDNDIIYIPVSIGIYVFSFTNFDIDDLEVFFTEYTFSDNNTEQENETPESENLTVPSQGIWQFNVTKSQPEMTCSFKAEKSFTPLMQFYSDEVDEVEIYIKILDAYGNELQELKLNQKNCYYTYEIMGEFSFTENEEYQLQVYSDIQIENVLCSLSFSETENED